MCVGQRGAVSQTRWIFLRATGGSGKFLYVEMAFVPPVALVHCHGQALRDAVRALDQFLGVSSRATVAKEGFEFPGAMWGGAVRDKQGLILIACPTACSIGRSRYPNHEQCPRSHAIRHAHVLGKLKCMREWVSVQAQRILCCTRTAREVDLAAHGG